MERTRTSARTLLLGTAVSLSLGLIAAPLSFDTQTLTVVSKAAAARNGGGNGSGHGGGNAGGNGGGHSAGAAGADATASAGQRGEPAETAGDRGIEASGNPNAGPDNNNAENASDMAREKADENSAVARAAAEIDAETTGEETTGEDTATEETAIEQTTGDEAAEGDTEGSVEGGETG
ncbi:MAG TPA: hypothetical protein VF987_08940 [Rhodospirillales bacterium]